MENKTAVRNAWRLGWLSLAAAAALAAFFQGAKHGPFRGINPFLDDPADAVGSIAFQLALVAGLLSLARGLRVRSEPERLLPRGRWIVNSSMLVAFAMAATLIGDGVMEIVSPSWGFDPWGKVLVLGLVFVADVTALLGIAIVRAWRSLNALADAGPAAEAGSLGGAVDDLWRMFKALTGWVAPRLPFLRRPLAWLERLGDRFLGWLADTPIDPEDHPWSFVLAAGILVGVLLVLIGFQEGLPPSLAIFWLLLAVFVSVETSAALLGFLLVGGVLGIRPPLK